MQSLEELRDAVKDASARLARVITPAAIRERADPAEALRILSNIERRLVEGPRAPVRVALFGPTGAGKSKIFNSLAGELLSPASYRRPCTRRPVQYLHRSHEALARAVGDQARLHSREEWRGLVLIDVPDFDSVEAENRREAQRIYLEADAFIFVADVHKYADASVWAYLERIRAEGKRAIFVLNKVAPGGRAPGSPLADFGERLRETFGAAGPPGPVIALGDHPQGDEELLPEADPGLPELRRELGRLLVPGARGGPAILVESLRIDLDRFLRAWDAFAVPLREYRAGLARLSGDVRARFARSAQALEQDLKAQLDPALKGEVYRQVLRRIERMDILRYPRKLLALPALGLKLALGQVWPRLLGGSASGATPDEALEAVNLAALEGRIQDFSEETRQALRSEPACPGLLDDGAYRSLRLDHGAVRDRYRATLAEFRDWVQTMAGSTAQNLTAEHRVKFILSQLIYNTVVIGVQVKTAGTFTLHEMLTDGVLSPLVAKAVGMAVSSERVAQFEEEARREHARRLQSVLEEAQERFLRFLAEAESGLSEIEELAPRVERLREAREKLVERFAGSGR